MYMLKSYDMDAMNIAFACTSRIARASASAFATYIYIAYLDAPLGVDGHVGHLLRHLSPVLVDVPLVLAQERPNDVQVHRSGALHQVTGTWWD